MFSGIGGFELGINKSFQGRGCKTTHSRHDMSMSGSRNEWGWGNSESPSCIGSSEIDKYAIQIYNKHFKGHKNYGNCTDINWDSVENFDLLVGGFPCQAFSIAGKRKGFSDTRGTLFFEIARCLREKQPRLFLLENVKGLLSHDKGRTATTILATLDELGYDVQWQVLNSKNFGVPQNRERVFIVGHLRGTSRPEVFPIGGSSCENKNQGRGLTPVNFKHFAGDGMGTRSRTKTELSCTLAGQPGQNGAMLIDENPQIRRLTPTECERLQGFPDGWTDGISDTQRYKCLGNAVTVNVIQAIMEKLLA